MFNRSDGSQPAVAKMKKFPRELHNVYADPGYAGTVKNLKGELDCSRAELNDHDQYVDGPPS